MMVIKVLRKVKASLKQQIGTRLARHGFYPRAFVFHSEKSGDNDTPETIFDTADGREIPVFQNHRYGLKPCWKIFGPLSALADLDARGLLSAESRRFLEHAKGHRTILEPLSAIRNELAPYLDRHADLFLSAKIPDIGLRLLKPSKAEIEGTITAAAKTHTAVLNKIRRVTSRPPRAGEPALEIGYTSGGESIMGLERIGFKASGIDNFYGDSVESTRRHEFISQLAGSHVDFIAGDITKKTSIRENSLSYIYSLSVIEHIENVPAAFDEMFRILRPGGVMFHRYDPYFYIRGAHSAGTLDSPWAHLRLTPAEMESYIRRLRPHEAEITLPWIKSALNRNHSQNKVLNALSRSGFRICLWETTAMKSSHLPLLTADIARECLALNDGVSIDDLTSAAVTFIAEKPLDSAA